MRPLATLLRLAALVLVPAFLFAAPAAAQTGVLRGRVLDAVSHTPLPFASVRVPAAKRGALTDTDGRFEFTALPAGQYNLEVALLGYRARVVPELDVSPAKPAVIEVVLDAAIVSTDSIAVVASPFRRTPESPVSLQTIGEAEIERYPGGNRDISNVLQSMPGVAPSVSYRNDVIVRGGAPGENRFYLDDIEVPNINHFATQGSSGGPVGMINVDFLREVNLFTSAFPANRGNALSSVLDFRMKDGNDARRVTSLTLGASDLGLTMDGPLGRNANYILSARRSYLQFVFKALDLPFLPTYNDGQFRLRWRPDPKDELTLLGLGAIDQFAFNLNAKPTELNRYVLDNLPATPQWNWTLGGTWKRFDEHGWLLLALSRNELDNRSTKYAGNATNDPSKLLQDYRSRETENKLRLEHVWQRRALRVAGGLEAQAATYTNATWEQRVLPAGVSTVDYRSRLDLARGAAFAQVSDAFADGRLGVSAALRTDVADYTRGTRDPLRQLSPRLALSWTLAPRWTASASVARYWQLPPYTLLGYRSTAGALVNRDAGVGWIRADHFVAGLEHATTSDGRVSLEGFLKRYADAPMLTAQGIALANLGADYGVIGDAPATSTARGRSWGAELALQQKLHAGWYGIAAATWVRSEFQIASGSWAPSAWDDRLLLSLTGGKKLPRHWEVGARWRWNGGAPYTPDDVALSSLRSVWDVAGRAYPDWSRLDAARTGPFHQLDARVDRRFFPRGHSLDAYLDVQNLYGYRPKGAPILVVDRDAAGQPIVDPGDPTRYRVHELANDLGNVFPTVGLVLTF